MGAECWGCYSKRAVHREKKSGECEPDTWILPGAAGKDENTGACFRRGLQGCSEMVGSGQGPGRHLGEQEYVEVQMFQGCVLKGK